jgi:hypothetical protein
MTPSKASRTAKASRTPKARSTGFPQDLDPLAKLILFGLGLISLGLLLALVLELFSRNKTYNLTLAAGSPNGESYILSKAIEKVVEANHPNIQIEVKQSGGSADSLKQLEAGTAQLAATQADVPTGANARLIVVLYQDLFQLVVKGNARITNFEQLKGRRIGLEQKGGQYRSFVEVAQHYGLEEKDFVFVGDNEQQAAEAFRKNQVDAVFRVRAPGNKIVLELVQNYQGRLLPIDQAPAMRLKYPAFEDAKLPRGAYQGNNPTVPAADLPTVGVQRLLVARKDVDDQVIQEITNVLDSRRQELAEAIAKENGEIKPLFASIARPSTTGGTGTPVHPGAIAHFERDKPSFVQENADYVALILTVILLFTSWLAQLKAWIDQRKKNASDDYINHVVEQMDQRQGSLDLRQKNLDDIFKQAAQAMVQERISQESFRTFNEAYKTVREVLERERQAGSVPK